MSVRESVSSTLGKLEQFFVQSFQFGCCSSCPWKSEHQPRLISYLMRVQLRHLIEQFLVGLRGFLQPLEVLEVTLGVFEGESGAPVFL